ncbi:unnamed protein product [Phaeothamnion confervicola]
MHQLQVLGTCLGSLYAVWLWRLSISASLPNQRFPATWISIALATALRMALRFISIIAHQLSESWCSFDVFGQRRLILWCLPFTSSSEKVRWSIEEYGGEAADEWPISPTLLPEVVRWQVGRSSEPKWCPLLIAGKRVLAGVPDIMRFADNRSRRLYPNQEAHDIEAYLDSCFAAPAEHVAFAHLLALDGGCVDAEDAGENNDGRCRRPGLDLFYDVATRDLPPWQCTLTRLLLPAAVHDVSRHWRLEERFEDNVAAVDQVFNVVEQFLSDGRLFLAGEDFSAADITFAALAAPILLPPEMAPHLLTLDPALPPAYAATVRRFRDTRAGRFALSLYAKQRQPAPTEYGRAAAAAARGGGSIGGGSMSAVAAAKQWRRRGRSRSSKQTVNSKSDSLSPPNRDF